MVNSWEVFWALNWKGLLESLHFGSVESFPSHLRPYLLLLQVLLKDSQLRIVFIFSISWFVSEAMCRPFEQTASVVRRYGVNPLAVGAILFLFYWNKRVADFLFYWKWILSCKWQLRHPQNIPISSLSLIGASVCQAMLWSFWNKNTLIGVIVVCI